MPSGLACFFLLFQKPFGWRIVHYAAVMLMNQADKAGLEDKQGT